MLELEGVELFAHFLDLCGLCGIAVCKCGDHIFLEKCEIAVKCGAASLLACLALEEHCLGKLITDSHNGVKAGKGILEDHCDFIAADLIEFVLGDLEKIH